jgi:hypothetical protein
MAQTVIPETVHEDDEEESEDARSENTDVWEAQWDDFGELPSTIPEFNVALSDFIVKQLGTPTTFPQVLRKEGGIHSYARFTTVFNRPSPKIIKILGGKVSTIHESALVKCIAMANFLKILEFSILGKDDVPEYTDFNQDTWNEYVSDHLKPLTIEFRRELNTHRTYEQSLKEEYIQACNLGSKQSSKTSSANTMTSDQSTPRVTTGIPVATADPTARKLHFNLTSPSILQVSTPGSFMQRVQSCAGTSTRATSNIVSNTSD